MKIEQIYTGCLAQGAYYIESGKEAAIIDPLREVDDYVRMSKERGTTIKYIFETHFHADFVSGHVELAKRTGARIVYGPTQVKTGFDAIIAEDGQVFHLGNMEIKLIHTPGHTMESSCYLLSDEAGVKKAIFTGDTLFIGDVGRPDLAQHVNASLNQEKLAGHLFDSLQSKIMPLEDDLIVYPAHGAGSACGKNLSSETWDTLGHQKKTNWALRPGLDKKRFVTELLQGLTMPPVYFPQNVLMNIGGGEEMNAVFDRSNKALSVWEFELLAEEKNALILDTRKPEEFGREFIPGSINIGIDGSFAVWVGTLVKDIRQNILFVADEGREEEVIIRLARVGYDHAIGYLKGGIRQWKAEGRPVDSIKTLSIDEFAEATSQDNDSIIIDVRKKSEYDSEHIVNAINIPLDYINDNMAMVPKDKQAYVHCAGGYRSMIFASILRARGYRNLVDVDGGFKNIKSSGRFEVTDYVCPTTML